MEFEELQYPCEVINFEREKKIVNNFEEHLEHAQSSERGTPLGKLAISEITPSRAVTDYTWSLMDIHGKIKRYGANFVFPNGIDTVPNKTLMNLDFIANEMDNIEARKTKESADKK